MCRSVLRPNLRKSFYCPVSVTIKPFTKSAVLVAEEPPTNIESNAQNLNKESLDLSFENTVAAFKSKTTWEVLRAYFVLKLSTSEYLIENHQMVRLINFF